MQPLQAKSQRLDLYVIHSSHHLTIKGPAPDNGLWPLVTRLRLIKKMVGNVHAWEDERSSLIKSFIANQEVLIKGVRFIKKVVGNVHGKMKDL